MNEKEQKIFLLILNQFFVVLNFFLPERTFLSEFSEVDLKEYK